MKRYLLLIILVLSPLVLSARTITEPEAQSIAHNFMNAPTVNSAGHRVARAPRHFVKASSNVVSNQQFYIYNSTAGDGFVIVSGDDIARPILGYSNEDNFVVDSIPDNLLYWLGEYNNQIKWAQANSVLQTEEIANLWTQYRSMYSTSSAVVGPLLLTKWNQNSPFNDLCPKYSLFGRCASGCVATATAQVMKYYNYPIMGVGSKMYTTKTHGFQLYADFGSTYYEWAQMINNYEHYYSYNSTQANAVAKLLYHVGIACEMDYDESSAAYMLTAARALKDYFSYSNSIVCKRRFGYSDADWMSVLLNQLDRQIPIIYGGQGSANESGHCFVLDGYDSNYLFHVNWGWGGTSDGYFAIDALTPSQGGIGAGNANYNYQQEALINVTPESKLVDLQLYENFLSADTIYEDDSLYISNAIINVGTGQFSGDIKIIAINADTREVYELESNTVHLGTFNPLSELGDGYIISRYVRIDDLDPGDYVIAFAYQKTFSYELELVSSDYHKNSRYLRILPSRKLKSGKYLLSAYGNNDNMWFMSSNLTTTSTKRLLSDTIFNTNPTCFINPNQEYVWEVSTNVDGTYTIKNNNIYLSWNSGNSVALSTTPKPLTLTPIDGKYMCYEVSFMPSATETRYLSLNTSVNPPYFAFYANKGQKYMIYFTEIIEDEEPIETSKNEYYILAKRATGNYYFLTPDKVPGKDRLIAVDAGTSIRTDVDTINTPASYLWSIEENGDGLYLESCTNQFLNCTAAKTATLSNTGLELFSRNNADGTITLHYAASPTEERYLSLATTGNDYFVFYANEYQFTHLLVMQRGNTIPTDINVKQETPQIQKIVLNGEFLIKCGEHIYNMQGMLIE